MTPAEAQRHRVGRVSRAPRAHQIGTDGSKRRIRTMLYAVAVKVKIHSTRPTAVADFAQAAYGLHPPEALLDERSFLLAHGVPRMSGGARLDRTAALRRVLSDVYA